MKGLLKSGYKAKLRPSGHDISEKFNIDNGASIPPNLIAIPNTESNSNYLRLCKEYDNEEALSDDGGKKRPKNKTTT